MTIVRRRGPKWRESLDGAAVPPAGRGRHEFIPSMDLAII